MINTIIVDDEPLAREILEAHVGNIPDLNLLASCSNAIEANKVINENDVDLMFLDIQMPEMDGLDATVKILSYFADLPRNAPIILAMTANVLDKSKKECEEVGMKGFITKPVAPKELSDNLKKWLV